MFIILVNFLAFSYFIDFGEQLNNKWYFVNEPMFLLIIYEMFSRNINGP